MRRIAIAGLLLTGCLGPEEDLGISPVPEPELIEFQRFGSFWWDSEQPTFLNFANLALTKEGEVWLSSDSCLQTEPLQQALRWTQNGDGTLRVTPTGHQEGDVFTWGTQVVFAVKIREGGEGGVEILLKDDPSKTYWSAPLVFEVGQVCPAYGNRKCDAVLGWFPDQCE